MENPNPDRKKVRIKQPSANLMEKIDKQIASIGNKDGLFILEASSREEEKVAEEKTKKNESIKS